MKSHGGSLDLIQGKWSKEKLNNVQLVIMSYISHNFIHLMFLQLMCYFTKFFIFNLICKSFLPVCMYVCILLYICLYVYLLYITNACIAFNGQEMAFGSLELELLKVVRSHVGAGN